MPASPVGDGIERRSGVPILFGYPVLHFGIVAVLQPPVGIGDGDAVQRLDHRITSGARWRHRIGQPRPMFGRLPWFALLRRMRAFFFLVFFDIRVQPSGGLDPSYQVIYQVRSRVGTPHRHTNEPEPPGNHVLSRTFHIPENRRVPHVFNVAPSPALSGGAVHVDRVRRCRMRGSYSDVRVDGWSSRRAARLTAAIDGGRR